MKEKKKQLRISARRSAEIFAVFTKHNFYSDGFTPKEMRTTLEDLGPTYVKIGQIMSSRTDILPESYCKELEKLRMNVKPLEASVVRQVIEEETGKKIEEIYSEFRDEPLGSASIAQAHYGVLLDGTKVVTKVQRPLVADMVRQDFIMLKKLASMVNAVTETDEGNLIDFKSVIRELEKVTEEELDFRIEAENTRTFRNLCIEDESVVSCPGIIDELTTERILTQTFVDGYSIAKTEKADEDGVDRQKVAEALLENYMHQVLDVGVFHGDPHQGNIMISGGVPYFIDFGMLGHISEQNIGIIEEMVMALLQKNADHLTNIILSMGITPQSLNKAKLTEDLDLLIERYMSRKDISSLDMGEIMSDLMSLLAKHRINIPSEYTMLARSMVTIEGVLTEFCPDLKLFDMLTEKMIARAKESFDLRKKLINALRDIMTTGAEAVQMPGALITLLRNLSKGRMKVGIELTGYDELVVRVQDTVKNVVLSFFSCIIFIGSCIVCTTDIEPKLETIPFIALLGFVFSTALGIYSVIRLSKK